ncbi:MAG: biotin synthase BioB [Nitrospirae bacterium]|nr:biotin synthase BioB [Nitrospirota bacterium]
MTYAMSTDRLKEIEARALSQKRLSTADAEFLSSISGQNIFELFSAANRIRHHFQGNNVDLCSIVNAKSGRCPEDCSYCAQSAKSSARIPAYPLLEKKQVLCKAEEARKGGAKRFCIVTSGRRVSGRELLKIADMISCVKKLGLLPCATLGLLTRADLNVLKKAGLKRYHNNLETSERFFPNICTTHSYNEKQETIRSAREAGLSVCSGGIFGLGETWQDRIEMAFALRDLDPDSVPINFFVSVKGAPINRQKPLNPIEALKIISLYRFILPDKQIRVCGGRLQTLNELNAFIFFAGASGLLIGNYLTTLGRDYADDLQLISELGFPVR